MAPGHSKKKSLHHWSGGRKMSPIILVIMVGKDGESWLWGVKSSVMSVEVEFL